MFEVVKSDIWTKLKSLQEGFIELRSQECCFSIIKQKVVTACVQKTGNQLLSEFGTVLKPDTATHQKC